MAGGGIEQYIQAILKGMGMGGGGNVQAINPQTGPDQPAAMPSQQTGVQVINPNTTPGQPAAMPPGQMPQQQSAGGGGGAMSSMFGGQGMPPISKPTLFD